MFLFVSKCAAHLSDGGLFAVPDDDLSLHGLGQPGDELVVDARLDEDPVGADAGLSGVAKLGGHAAGDGLLHVGRVEHDEGRVAAQLQRYLLHRAGALPVDGDKLGCYFGDKLSVVMSFVYILRNEGSKPSL